MSKYLNRSLKDLLEDCSLKRTKALYAFIDKKAKAHPVQALKTLSFNYFTIHHLRHKNGYVLAETVGYLLRHAKVRSMLRLEKKSHCISTYQLYAMMLEIDFCDTDIVAEFFLYANRMCIPQSFTCPLHAAHVEALSIALEKSEDKNILSLFAITNETGITDKIADWLILQLTELSPAETRLETAVKNLREHKMHDHIGRLLLYTHHYATFRESFCLDTQIQGSFDASADDRGTDLPEKFAALKSSLPSYSSFPAQYDYISEMAEYRGQIAALHKCVSHAESSFRKLREKGDTARRMLSTDISESLQNLSAMHGVYYHRVYALMQAFCQNTGAYHEVTINRIIGAAEPSVFKHLSSHAIKKLYLAARDRFLAKVRKIGQSEKTHDAEKQSTKRRKVEH